MRNFFNKSSKKYCYYVLLTGADMSLGCVSTILLHLSLFFFFRNCSLNLFTRKILHAVPCYSNQLFFNAMLVLITIWWIFLLAFFIFSDYIVFQVELNCCCYRFWFIMDNIVQLIGASVTIFFVCVIFLFCNFTFNYFFSLYYYIIIMVNVE